MPARTATPEEQYLMTATLITGKQVHELLRKELVRFEKVVNNSIKVPINQNQYDALVSIAFNIGSAGFQNSTFVRRINNQEPDERIRAAILTWNKPSEIMGEEKKVELFFS